ncbi:transposase domain-containing protein [Paraburkholderia sp. SIMBA_054]|uniref:transposase domain-containing protein n=1 Tax=Paraburkholderia sp. SIMBA_054 TaxID=3085795 RepID=UPI00397D7A0F
MLLVLENENNTVYRKGFSTRNARRAACSVTQLPARSAAQSIVTCRPAGAATSKPYAYLAHVLAEFPQGAPDSDMTELLPFDFIKLTAKAALGPAAHCGRPADRCAVARRVHLRARL